MSLAPELLAGIVLAVAGAALAAAGLVVRRTDPARAALAELDADAGVEEQAADEFSQRLAQPLPARLLGPIAQQVSGAVAGLLPSNRLERIRTRLALAGLSGRVTPEEFLTLQVLSAIAGLAGGAVVLFLLDGTQALAAGALVAFIGAAGPRGWVDHVRDERVESIRADLPDTLDLLAISVEAGSGFEQSMAMVVDRFGSGEGREGSPLADELGHTLREMQLGVSRREALQNLQQRTQVSDLSAFVTALVQADGLGMPITQVLRTQAEEMRRRKRQRVREKANQLPVKLLFPMVAFIMPSLFVILLGPAALQMVDLL